MQIVLEAIINDTSGKLQLPGAIKIDVVGKEGTIRTDTVDSDAHGYAFSDTLILWTVRRACAKAGADRTACGAAERELHRRRAGNPLFRWDDGNGRRKSWPV